MAIRKVRGKWVADVGTEKDGARQRISFETRREAVAFEKAAVAAKETTGLQPVPRSKSPTLIEAYQLWLNSRIHETGCRESTIKTYRYQGKEELYVWAADEPEIPASKDRYGLARLKLSELTEPVIQAWVNALLRRLKPNGVKKALRKLSAIIDYARRAGIYKGYNWAPLVLKWLNEQKSPIFKKTKLKVGIDIPTDAEANAYLHAAAQMGTMHEAMELLKVHCGLRIGEVRGLLWSDIDLDDNRPVLNIRHTADFYGKILNHTKTDAGMRTIPLPDHIVAVLRRWRNVCPGRGGEKAIPIGWERAEEIAKWLVANPTSTNCQIARRLSVHFTTVAEVRKRLGMSRWDHVLYQQQPQIVEPPEDSDCPPVTATRFGLRSISQSKAQICARYLWHNPCVQYGRLAEVLNVSTTYLCDLRKSLGMQKLRKGRSHHVLLTAPDPNMKRQLTPGGEKHLVFPSEVDISKPPTTSCCQRWAVKIQLAAGLRDVNNQPKYQDGKKYERANHIWRHYFVTMLLARGYHWKQIANLSGHENAPMVMETYGHLVRDLEADRQMLGDAIRAARTPKLRVVENDEKLLGTKMADFGTDQS